MPLKKLTMVYVDDMCNYKIGKLGRMKMSHMIADTRTELLEMADKVGVARKWIQCINTPREHFDICKAKRKMVIALGAEEITWRELGEIVRLRKDYNRRMRCFQCYCEITSKDNGACINQGTPHEMYQCNDCHFAEFGVNITGSLLVFQ